MLVKEMRKKIVIPIMIVLSIILSVFISPMIFAASDAKITVSTVSAKPGDTVDVAVTFANNPGIMGATLTVTYDDNALTLQSVQDGGILGTQSHKPELKSPYTLAWSDDTAVTNNTSNGVAAALTFKVSDSAVAGQSYPIAVSYDYDNYDIYDVDLDPVDFALVNGSVNVFAEGYIRGDADGNGFVNIKDVTTIQRHRAEYLTLTGDRFKAADVDCNSEVTIVDATAIQFYLAEFNDPYQIGAFISSGN